MECELNGRLIRLDDDGELYYWYDYTSRGVVKNPYWRKYKQSITMNTKGKKYKVFPIKNRRFKAHRVIYYIHNQEWNIWDNSQSNLIDHIDNDGLNNNIENLRPATHQQNMCNTIKQQQAGYFITKSGNYQLRLKSGKTIRQSKTYKTEQEAIDAVAEFRLKYHQF